MSAQALERWQFLHEALAAENLPMVMDVGANPLDDPPYKPLLDARLCRVHGFEPQPEAFARLQSDAGELESYTNAAVGDGAEHKLNVYRSSGLTSFYDLDSKAIDFLGRGKGQARLLEQVAVETRRLDDVADIEHFDLLKIDVQGAEKMIFQNGAKKLSQAVAVITELRLYPLYEDEPLLNEEMALLSDFGFRFHKFQFIKNQMVANSQKDRLRTRRIGSQALDADGIFVRDLRDADRITDAQLKALAMVADAVFESFDLTLHCIDLLSSRGALPGTAAASYVDLLPAELRKD